MFAGLLVLWVVDGRIKKEQVLHALFAVILVATESEMVKNLLPVARPYMRNGGPPLTLTIPVDGTFPSLHAAIAFALAITVWLHNKKLGYIFILAAVLVALGRVLGHVHYFSDVFGGGVLGAATAIMIEKLHLYKLV